MTYYFSPRWVGQDQYIIYARVNLNLRPFRNFNIVSFTPTHPVFRGVIKKEVS